MRIAICEDEKVQSDLLVGFVNKWMVSRKVKAEMFVYDSAESFLSSWSTEKVFDLLFLDIQMGRMDGMMLAETIRKLDLNIEIVFVTGIKDYVFRGYEVRALRYILKPIRLKDCIEALDKARFLVDSRKDDVFVVPMETQSIRLLLNDIFYFESFSHFIDIHTNRGVFRYRQKLSNIEEQLPVPHFFRTHRSYVVNMRYVRLINREQLEMDDQTVLPVAKARWADLNHAYLQYNDQRGKAHGTD